MRASEECEIVLEKFFEYVKNIVHDILKKSNSICTLQILYQIVAKYIDDNFNSLESCKNFVKAQWNIDLERLDQTKYVQYLLNVCNILESKIFDTCMEVLSKFIGTRHRYIYTKLSLMISSYISSTLGRISRLCRKLKLVNDPKMLSMLESILFLISLRSIVVCKIISSYSIKELLTKIEIIESNLQQIVAEEAVISESLEELLRE